MVANPTWVVSTWRDDHGGWEYVTLLAVIRTRLNVVANWEGTALHWVPADEVDALNLHPGFARAWANIGPGAAS